MGTKISDFENKPGNFFGLKFSGGRLLLNEGRQSIGDCAVVTQAGYFVLSAQFTDALHVIDETVFLYRGNFKPLQDITGDEVIVIYIPVAQVVVDPPGDHRLPVCPDNKLVPAPGTCTV